LDRESLEELFGQLEYRLGVELVDASCDCEVETGGVAEDTRVEGDMGEVESWTMVSRNLAGVGLSVFAVGKEGYQHGGGSGG